MWYVYILLCDQNTYYVGITPNLKERVREHREKQSFFTKKYSELKPVYLEKYLSKTEAAKREKQLKGWSRAKKQLLLSGDLGINSIELAEVPVGLE